MLERPLSMATLTQTLRGLSMPYGEETLKGQEDTIFELFKIPGKNEASIGRLLTVLKSFGLRTDDPRLKPMMRKLKQIEKQEEAKMNEATEPKHWKLSREQFKECVACSLELVSQALQNNLVIPSWHTFVDQIRIFYQECAEIRDGSVATYIPQLARQSPDQWGVSICTVDGQRVSFGDSKKPFCVQSVSKAFNYAIAASDLGADYVHSYVGEEPSGRLFNDICLDSRKKPHNPMVNSGAIIVTSLIKNTSNMADRFDYVITQYRKIAGGEYIGFNNATFLSERATADRNYALSYYMKENKCFPPETTSLTDALDFYFQLCSIEGNCESLSVMAATLANGGVCPITNEKCIDSNPCRDVLSLMYSCGMYDASGQFSFSVGLPAKSGVSGVMIVVVPNVMGIALWSPALDGMGNSCRGVAFCKVQAHYGVLRDKFAKLIAKFNFHNYDCLLHTTSNKVDPRRRDHRERECIVPALYVARSRDMVALRRLYMQGVDLSASDYDKRTPLHVAASEGDLTMLKFLVNVAKVDITAQDRWGRSPLDDARFFKHQNCVQFLEKALSRPEGNRSQSVSSEDSEEEANADYSERSDPPRAVFTIDSMGNY
ncbi:glutaminase A [Ancylostoma ceylanicum]|uniref:glutaminase n=1 Tax=Ancylostoma ceylanicum TaxID=53326 RepID=A0A0D6M546_9BILA|nr:glutaminase A [Ancylostoma ceylanicum]